MTDDTEGRAEIHLIHEPREVYIAEAARGNLHSLLGNPKAGDIFQAMRHPDENLSDFAARLAVDLADALELQDAAPWDSLEGLGDDSAGDDNRAN